MGVVLVEYLWRSLLWLDISKYDDAPHDVQSDEIITLSQNISCLYKVISEWVELHNWDVKDQSIVNEFFIVLSLQNCINL